MTFLEKLDRLLEQRHLNRSSLSAKAGIPYTTIDNWYKRGYEGLKLSTAGKLADFFGTTTDYFLREELTDAGARATLMTGSGSAVYGIFASELEALSAMGRMLGAGKTYLTVPVPEGIQIAETL